MSAVSSASTNPVLTTFAQQIAPDLRQSAASSLCPEVKAPSAKARFKIFDEENTWQAYDTERALGGPATRIPWKASDGQLNLAPHALEGTIDDFEREADDLSLLQKSKVRSLLTTAMLSHEKDLVTYLNATVSAIASTWDASTDPIEAIDTQMAAIEKALGGLPPNKIRFSTDAWIILRNNAKVQARFKTGFVGVTKDLVQSAFLFPECQIEIGGLVYNSAKRGATQSKTRILGNDVWIYYNSQTPDMEDPSFAKCFTTGAGGVQTVRTYRDESARSEVLAVDWNREFKVTNTQAVKRLTVSAS